METFDKSNKKKEAEKSVPCVVWSGQYWGNYKKPLRCGIVSMSQHQRGSLVRAWAPFKLSLD